MWTLTKVTRTAKSDLLQSVMMEFSDGAATKLYAEPNVSDVSDAGIANLARNQLAQLNRIASTPPGEANLDAIKALLDPRPPAEDSDAAKKAQISADLQRHTSLQRAVALGLLPADDAEVTETKAALDGWLRSDRDLLLSLIR